MSTQPLQLSEEQPPVFPELIGGLNRTPKMSFNSDQVHKLRRKSNGYTGYMVIPMVDGHFDVNDVALLPDVLKNLIRKAPEKE